MSRNIVRSLVLCSFLISAFAACSAKIEGVDGLTGPQNPGTPERPALAKLVTANAWCFETAAGVNPSRKIRIEFLEAGNEFKYSETYQGFEVTPDPMTWAIDGDKTGTLGNDEGEKLPNAFYKDDFDGAKLDIVDIMHPSQYLVYSACAN